MEVKEQILTRRKASEGELEASAMALENQDESAWMLASTPPVFEKVEMGKWQPSSRIF